MAAFVVTRSAHHLTLFRRVRVRKCYVKATLAYGGACLMAFDASASIAGPLLFPHVFHAVDVLIACAGKVGAASAGLTAFFDRIIEAAVEEGA